MKTIARRLSPFAILLPASLLSACASLGNAGLGGSQQNPTNQLLNMIDEAILASEEVPDGIHQPLLLLRLPVYQGRRLPCRASGSGSTRRLVIPATN
ncbi:hypothetical protein IPC443_23485 [Pseudomonas aeruginosa]|nr:hypothetical protein IPC443_23485 [Pseudomonas aeruginosa]